MKIINEEIEESNTQIRELRKLLDATNQRIIVLLKKREQFSNDWKIAGMKDLGLEILNHLLRENTILVENMEYSRKDQKTDF